MPVASPEEMYCASQIKIPATFPNILKSFAKAAIRTQPHDLLHWTSAYFHALAENRLPPVKVRLEYLSIHHPEGLTLGYLRTLLNQFGRPLCGQKIALKTLFKRWQGIGLSTNFLYQILMIGRLLHRHNQEIDLYRFLAIACGILANNLRETVNLVCELLTNEPEGGSSMIPLRTMLGLYGYLARLDCSGKTPMETPEIVGESSRTSSCSLGGLFLPTLVPSVSRSICTCDEMGNKIYHNSTVDMEYPGTTADDADSLDDDDKASLECSAYPSMQVDKMSAEILGEESGVENEEVMSFPLETPSSPYNENEHITSSVDISVAVDKSTDGSQENESERIDEDESHDENVTNDQSSETMLHKDLSEEVVDNIATKSQNDGSEENEVEETRQTENIDRIQSVEEKDGENPENGGKQPDPDNILEGICDCRQMSNVSEEEKEKLEKTVSMELPPTLVENNIATSDGFSEWHTNPPYVDYDVPGIGPLVSEERVTQVGLWLTECARRQHGLVGPRNFVHFLCPQLQD